MKSYTVATLFLSTALLANAGGLTYHPTNNTFTCSVPNGCFCAGDSMGTSVMISFKDGIGTTHDCCADLNDKNAQCYQSSTEAGDAACASNGTAFPASGAKFAIPPAPAGKNNTTPNTPALISSDDDDCECGGPPPNNGTAPTMPVYPSSSPAGPAKSSPAPKPPPSTPVAPVVPSSTPCESGYTGSHSIGPSSVWTSSALPSNWNPQPSPTPTYATQSTAKAPVFTGAAVAHKVGVEVLAAAGFAVLLL